MTKQTRIAVGKYIRKLRLAKGWTQEHLGNLARTNGACICNIELGKANWKIDTIGKILKALGAKTGMLEIIIL
jgi:predicted transcriptional regulator